MAQRRMSKLQSIILDELTKSSDKVAYPSNLSYAVASRYAPNKFWRLKDVKEPLAYALCRSIHQKKELIRNDFSASFSRSLRDLEKKHLIQLVKGRFEGEVENTDYIYYRIKTPQPRVTLIVHYESPYFGKESPDVSRFIDICNEITHPTKS